LQAKRIDEADLREAMTQFAAENAPYILRTTGLGIFTGEQTAVYISVVRNPALSALQTNMISSFASHMEGMSEQHFINVWMPHITLLLPEMLDGMLPKIIEVLAKRNFTWEMRISKLVLLSGIANDEAEPFTVTLTGNG
jgi:2'-5' RNA ligase